MEFSAFDGVKDAERHLTKEGRVGADNAGGHGAAIDVPSATKDTELGKGQRGEERWGRLRKSQEQRTPLQYPPSLLPQSSHLRRITNGGRGSPHCLWLHCAQYNDDATIATMTDVMLVPAVEQSKLPRAMFVFYLHMGMGEIHWREEGDPINNIE